MFWSIYVKWQMCVLIWQLKNNSANYQDIILLYYTTPWSGETKEIMVTLSRHNIALLYNTMIRWNQRDYGDVIKTWYCFTIQHHDQVKPKRLWWRYQDIILLYYTTPWSGETKEIMVTLSRHNIALLYITMIRWNQRDYGDVCPWPWEWSVFWWCPYGTLWSGKAFLSGSILFSSYSFISSVQADFKVLLVFNLLSRLGLLLVPCFVVLYFSVAHIILFYLSEKHDLI